MSFSLLLDVKFNLHHPRPALQVGNCTSKLLPPSKCCGHRDNLRKPSRRSRSPNVETWYFGNIAKRAPGTPESDTPSFLATRGSILNLARVSFYVPWRSPPCSVLCTCLGRLESTPLHASIIQDRLHYTTLNSNFQFLVWAHVRAPSVPLPAVADESAPSLCLLVLCSSSIPTGLLLPAPSYFMETVIYDQTPLAEYLKGQ